MATHQTAKVSSNSRPSNGGDWHLVEPLTAKQVSRNNNKKTVTVKRASEAYLPVMG